MFLFVTQSQKFVSSFVHATQTTLISDLANMFQFATTKALDATICSKLRCANKHFGDLCAKKLAEYVHPRR